MSPIKKHHPRALEDVDVAFVLLTRSRKCTLKYFVLLTESRDIRDIDVEHAKTRIVTRRSLRAITPYRKFYFVQTDGCEFIARAVVLLF